jgi:hypothetical protein
MKLKEYLKKKGKGLSKFTLKKIKKYNKKKLKIKYAGVYPKMKKVSIRKVKVVPRKSKPILKSNKAFFKK